MAQEGRKARRAQDMRGKRGVRDAQNAWNAQNAQDVQKEQSIQEAQGAQDARDVQEGIRRLPRTGGLLGARKLILPDAVPPCASSCPTEASPSSYGWVSGVLPVPRLGDRYLVEFLSETEYRVLAYVDRHGRVFSTEVPFLAPPAREPDVDLTDWAEQPKVGTCQGYVQVKGDNGAFRKVAQYRCVKGRFTLFDSWYAFGEHGENLTYDQALARCYFAFVHRPTLCGEAVPDSGLGFVFRSLREESPLVALRGIVCKVRLAENDAVMHPPALARCLADWLEEAGLNEALVATGHAAVDAVGMGTRRADLDRLMPTGALGQSTSDPLRLIRTTRYANTFYLGVEDDSTSVSSRNVWALEAALNRFLLIAEKLGDDAAVAGDAECGLWDARIIEEVARQALDAFRPVREKDASEWRLREYVGRALEDLRLPFRIEADLHADAAAGRVSFEVVAPDAALMPQRRWDEAAACWVDATDEERAAQALRYAEHIGLALALAALSGSNAIECVEVTARSFAEDGAGRLSEAADGAVKGPSIVSEKSLTADGATSAQGGMSSRQDAPFPQQDAPLYHVALLRKTLESDALIQAVSGDPAPLFSSCRAAFGTAAAFASAMSFSRLAHSSSAAARRDLPEVDVAQLSATQQNALGAQTTLDLRISYDALLRRAAEQAAEEVSRTTSATEAIRIVRAMQDNTGEPLVYEACTRLMTALAEGSVDGSERDALAACFLGEDPYAAALKQARAVVRRDPAQAASLLAEVIAQAEAGPRFADNAETVHRMFDSYAARIVYNRQRAVGGVDAGKRVEVLPATLLFCYLESAKILEKSFARADEALRYGTRCMQAAPTFSAGFRQTARAYMLVGDLESAASTLLAGLRIALQPEEIAIAYYQLAYVEWKAGRLDSGVACYLKSVMTSPVYGMQAAVELRELLHESGAHMIPGGEVDGVLEASGIPVAPQKELLDQLDDALRASVDANLFAVARPLLSLHLHYRPDDALVNVLRSLEIPALQ